MQVRKDENNDERYYVPVWDVYGWLYYQFADDYDPYAIVGGAYLVDNNNEREMFSDNITGVPSTEPSEYSILTINAIDGTVIDREIGY